MLSSALFIAQLWLVPAAGIEYFSPPPQITIEESRKKKTYVVIERGKPLRAEITGPATLKLDVRLALKKRDKSGKASIKVVIDTIEDQALAVSVAKATKKARVRYVGKGAPRGTEPSTAQALSLPVKAGVFFYELHVDGAERAFVALEAVAGAAPELAAAPPADLPALPGLDPLPPLGAPPPLPAGDSLPPVVDALGAPPPLDPAPLPAAEIAAAPTGPAPAAAPDKVYIEFFGDPPEVEIEELGESKPYRQMSKGKPLRATIDGPGTLMVAVRVPIKKGDDPEPFDIVLNVDGSELGSFPLEPKEAPSFAKTKFVKGGPLNAKPSTEEWFTAEVPVPQALCEFTFEGDTTTAYLNLAFRPAAQTTVVAAAGSGEAKQPFLTREQIEALARGAAQGRGSKRAETEWRIAIELAPSAAVLLQSSDPGFGGSLGVSLTPPFLGGVLGITLRGGYQRATGAIESDTSFGGGPVTLAIERQRETITAEAGLHARFGLSRRLHLMLGAGGGYYMASMRATSFGVVTEASGNATGAWGGLQLGVAAGPGSFFLAGRYFRAAPIEAERLTLDVRGVVTELGYAFSL